MVEQHRSDRAIVVGSSTHNERIERLWRDAFRCVASIFFKRLEEEEKLNPLNEIDIYCLNRVFLPRINAAFTESWNNHPISGVKQIFP